ncbi:MAG: circadian clock protein KaiC [Deltaproteobacteria bacterium]|nr:circadian clock protein KaiC [Deltaproteobacteria bacterium]
MVKRRVNKPVRLAKCPTGIAGLDEITGGGIPLGRPTLVTGSAGCGKTLLALEFLVHGAVKYGESGVFMAFEETAAELAQNVASLGFDLEDLQKRKKLAIDYVYIERSEIEDTGEYDLEGLFVRLGYAIDSVGAKRVVLDTVEALFAALPNENILRAELRRLFRWLKARGVTAIITGERGDNLLTRHGLEEYVADCVILLDFRIREQISTRRLRIIKYRGSAHGSDEYPFLIEKTGISILPVTSLGLNHRVSSERIPTGIPRLDKMLAGEGYFRGSTILISGSAGTGKSSFAAKFVEAACKRGERCLYFSFEESPSQITRNMASIGIDLAAPVKKGLLRFHASRPTLYGLESHLITFHNLILEFNPRVVVVDPVSNLTAVGTSAEVKSILTRLFDYLKMEQVTTLLTDLAHFGNNLEKTNEEISSLIDTWILLRDIEINGERNRGLYILKSRGMAHSNQIREVRLSHQGIDLVDVYLGPSGVLTGSARAAQESREKAEAATHRSVLDQKLREQERKRQALEARIEALRAEFAAESEELRVISAEEEKRQQALVGERADMARLRKAD